MPTTFADTITTNALPDSIRTIYSAELEFTSRPTLVYDQPAFVESRDDFAARRGNQTVWTIYKQLPASISPLVENQDVTGGSVADFQVSFRVQEYGNAIGTTEALDLTSYHGPISNIVRSLLAPQQALTMDTIARNMFWYAPNRLIMNPSATPGAAYHFYTGGASSRAAMVPSTSVMSSEVARAAAYRLTVRRVPTMTSQQPSYLCITHPSVTYDLRGDPYWKDAQLYAGATQLFNGEDGMIHGVRYIKSDRARIANGGAFLLPSQPTISTNYAAGVNAMNFSSVTGLAVGQEITLHNTGVSTTLNGVTWLAPDGQDPTAEEVIIQSISGSTVTFTQKTMLAHNSGDLVSEAYDVYPMIFLGGLSAMGKGIVVPPEIRVSLPVDKLRRISYVGWYSYMGYGIVRDWAYDLVETLATQNTPPPFSF